MRCMQRNYGNSPHLKKMCAVSKRRERSSMDASGDNKRVDLYKLLSQQSTKIQVFKE
jgi:hypothetical protein